MDIKLKYAMVNVVESLFPRSCDPALGMLIMIDCSYSNYDKDLNVRGPLYYLFQRPSNYTKVFFLSGFEDKNFQSPPSIYDLLGKVISWKLRSDHDSCWRDDGTRDLFNTERYIMQSFGGYPITDEKVHIFNTFGGLGNGFHYVRLAPFRINREESVQKIKILEALTIREAADLMPTVNA